CALPAGRDVVFIETDRRGVCLCVEPKEALPDAAKKSRTTLGDAKLLALVSAAGVRSRRVHERVPARARARAGCACALRSFKTRYKNQTMKQFTSRMTAPTVPGRCQRWRTSMGMSAAHSTIISHAAQRRCRYTPIPSVKKSAA